MKIMIKLLTLYLLLVLNISFGQTPNWQWAKKAGTTSWDDGTCITTDENGNVFVAGSFASPSLIFGTTTLVNADNSSQTFDIYVVKYDALGNIIWAKSARGDGNDYCKSISVDANGNVYMTGYFHSPFLNFGSDSISNSGFDNVYLVKYDSVGNFKWARNSVGSYEAQGYGVSVNSDGNIFITGYFDSPSLTFNTATIFNTDNMASTTDLFLVKYDSLGNVLWANQEGGTISEYGRSVATDNNGNSFITGDFSSDSITFGSTTLFNTGLINCYLVKYDSNGIVSWAKSANGNTSIQSNSITVDTKGNSSIAGFYENYTIIFDSDTLPNSGLSDLFIARYDSTGNILWARKAGGSGNELGCSISAGDSGKVYITGYFDGTTTTFGSALLSNANTSGITTDIFFLCLDSLGNIDWVERAGGIDYDWGLGVCSNASGEVMFTGDFKSSSINFGLNTLTNSGSFDLFVAKKNTLTGIDDFHPLTNTYVFPNPSIENATLFISLEQSQQMQILLFDITGREIETVFSGEITTGNHLLDVNRNNLSAGIYFVKLQIGGVEVTHKIVFSE